MKTKHQKKRYFTYSTLHLEFEFMFEECEEQETSPTHQQAEVLKEKCEARSVGFHSIHLWKLKKGKEATVKLNYKQLWQKCCCCCFVRKVWQYSIFVTVKTKTKKTGSPSLSTERLKILSLAPRRLCFTFCAFVYWFICLQLYAKTNARICMKILFLMKIF